MGEWRQPVSAGSHPKRSGVVFNDGRGGVGGEAVARAEGAEAFIAQDVESAGFCSYPDIAFAVFEDREDGCGSEWIGHREAVDLVCCPADKAAVGANPEAPFAVRVCRLNARTGKVFADGPVCSRAFSDNSTVVLLTSDTSTVAISNW